MQPALREFAEQLRAACAEEHAQFHIVYHINPDGDCIGSAYALALMLRTLGARADVIGRDPVPAQFRCLTDAVPLDVPDANAQYIGVDCKDRLRTGTELAQRQYRFWIDHHGSPETQADFEYVRPDYSACSELILELAEELGVPVTPQMAELMYTALVTDTSCFRTSSTNAHSFLSAAKLTGYGADAYEIGRRYTMVKSPERLRIEQTAFQGMHLLCGGRLVTMLLTLDDLHKTGITDQLDPALENINGLPEVIGTAEITVMIREYPADNAEGQTRFAVKTTKRSLSAKAVAEHFGGGGHPQAAGGFRREAPEAVRAMIEEYCAEMLAD